MFAIIIFFYFNIFFLAYYYLFIDLKAKFKKNMIASAGACLNYRFRDFPFISGFY